MQRRYGCPVQATVRMLSGKWKVQILWHLSFGPLRFAELRRKLGRVSEKVLAEQLRQLEHDGVVQRTVLATVPPQVSYALGSDGTRLVPMLEELCGWGSEHFDLEPSLPRRSAELVQSVGAEV